MCTQKVMCKKTHCLALVVGIIMVLAAGVWFVQTAHAKRTDTYQRLRIQQAVAQLEGCLTCHTITNAEPQSYNHAILAMASHTEIHLPDAVSPSSPLKSQVDTRLLALGQRILEVPESDDDLYQAVASDFLQVYDQSISATDPVVLGNALHALDGVEQLLRQLENQAQTEKWGTTPGHAAQDSPVMVQSSPPLPLPGVAHQFSIAPVPDIQTSSLALTAQVVVPVLFADDASRRGPPAVVVMESDLFSKGRLPLAGAQSSFLFWGTASHC